MTRLSVSEYVRESASPHGGSVLLDVRSGHCFAMNPMAHTLWQEWHRSGNFDSAVLVLATVTRTCSTTGSERTPAASPTT